MPRKRRVAKHRYIVTIEVMNAALSRHGWEAYWGGEEEGRSAWEVLKGELQTNLGTRPAPFWGYEPDVPEELRQPDLPGAAVDPAFEEVERRRMQWLLGPGADHLRPGETEAIRRELSHS